MRVKTNAEVFLNKYAGSKGISDIDMSTPADEIGIYIKYVVLSLIACVLFIGGCILSTVEKPEPKTSNGMPLIAIGCIVFAVAPAIYSVGKLTKKK